MAFEELLHAVAKLTKLVERTELKEPEILNQASGIIHSLVVGDDWLPLDMAQPDPSRYRQYLLYGDPLDRFSLVSFVWGPGQHTPIHDHTVWGVVGMLRGAELSQSYRTDKDENLTADGVEEILRPGQVTCVSPRIGDIHRVSNAYMDKTSISIHLYGGNIGRINRSVYDATAGSRKSFVSGYSNASLPNLWK